MIEDVVKALGYLTLGTRLKRIGDRLQAATQREIDAAQLPVQASQFPYLAALDRLGPLSVGELAQAIGVTQPGTTRTVRQLAVAGLVEVRQPPDDQRRSVVALSQNGRAIVAAARQALWPQVEAAVHALCRDLSGPLLNQLDGLEERLGAAPADQRRPPQERAGQ